MLKEGDSDDGLDEEERDSNSESGSPDSTVPRTVNEEDCASSVASPSARSESEEAENISYLRKLKFQCEQSVRRMRQHLLFSFRLL